MRRLRACGRGARARLAWLPLRGLRRRLAPPPLPPAHAPAAPLPLRPLPAARQGGGTWRRAAGGRADRGGGRPRGAGRGRCAAGLPGGAGGQGGGQPGRHPQAHGCGERGLGEATRGPRPPPRPGGPQPAAACGAGGTPCAGARAPPTRRRRWPQPLRSARPGVQGAGGVAAGRLLAAAGGDAAAGVGGAHRQGKGRGWDGRCKCWGLASPTGSRRTARIRSCLAAPCAAWPLILPPALVPAPSQALVALPTFLPDLKAYSGRALQLPGSSWLGPCFSPSVLPDPLIKQTPDVVAECFANPEARRQVRPGASSLSRQQGCQSMQGPLRHGMQQRSHPCPAAPLPARRRATSCAPWPACAWPASTCPGSCTAWSRRCWARARVRAC
jgi:hypothetical protein